MLAWLLLLVPTLTRAEIAVEAWVQRYNGTGNSHDSANAVAVDGSNDVIVTGYSYGSESFEDYLTIKYSSAGVPVWTNRYNGPENYFDRAYAATVDGSNNVIVTGSSKVSVNDGDYTTIKYSGAGVPLWTNRYNGLGNGDDLAIAVAVDGSNSVIVTGSSTGSGSGYDYLTIKYSSAGVPLWTNRYNGPGNGRDVATAVAVDGSNNVIVTGSSVGSGSYNDYATIKYSSAGVALWINRYNFGSGSDDSANALVVDSSNNVIVTGSSVAGSADYLTIKYSSAGVPLWTNRYDGSWFASDDNPLALAVDGSNNVIVTGWSQEIGNSHDYLTIQYSSAGVPLWTNRYDGPGNTDDIATAVAVDGSNSVIVTGHSGDSGGFFDCYLTIKYSSAGIPQWTNCYDGPARGSVEIASAVAVDRSNNVIVTGSSPGSVGGYDFATIKYFFPLVIADPQMTNGTFQMRVENVLQSGMVVIEASTTLAGWSPVFTNTTPTNVLFYADRDSGSYLRRFYRALQFP